MQEIDIATIEKHLSGAAEYYIKEVFEDVTHGLINRRFRQALKRYERNDIVELSTHPARFQLDYVKGKTTFGKGKFQLCRMVGNKNVSDIDEIRADPKKFFMDLLIKDIDIYVSTGLFGTASNDTPITHASMPTLSVKTEAYFVEWFLWGYYGKAINKEKAKHK